MKRTIIKALRFCLALSMASVFFSCSMMLDEIGNGASSSSVQDIRSMMNRSDSEQMLYMGGSVLYCPKDSNANQLIEGAIVATRIGKVIKKDLGCGQYAYQNSKTDYELGFISVDAISKAEISFSYYKFPSVDSNRYVAAGSFTLSEGQTADLNGDGIADVQFRKPDAGRKGYKSNMWLSFLCDVNAGDHAAMFSIIPMQYNRSVYPNGLLGINTTGQYVINKYDVGTNNRSVVSNISYGDYVLDTEANTLARYVGENRTSRSAARSISDAEVKEVEQISSNSTPEDFEFKAIEFTNEFDINELLGLMPAAIVTENWAGRSIAENVTYLNYLIREAAFISRLVEANPGEVADEVRAQLDRAAITSDVERVIFGRHVLALMYPDACPDVNLYSQTLSSIIPWMYIDFGNEIVKEEEASDTGRSVFSELTIKTVKQATYDAQMAQYRKEAREAHKDEVGKKTEEYIEYEVNRDAIEKYFSTLKSYNFAPLFASWLGKSWVKDIVKGTKLNLSVGVSGSISFANANPSIDFKLGLLLKVELEDMFALNVHSSSLFADNRPETEKVDSFTSKFNEKFPEGNFSADEVKDYLDTMNGIDLKDETGLNGWVWDAASVVQGANPVNGIRPSKDAKSMHASFNPVPQIPFVVTFDAQLDILFKAAAVLEFKNFTVGVICMQVLDCKAGIDWGFRDKLLGIPIPTSFYCDTYAAVNRYSENTGFVGITTIDRGQFSLGGGMRFTLCPVVEFRGGVGLGYNVLGAKADVTVGCGVDFFAPLTGYLGLARKNNGEHLIVTETSLDAGIGIHGDVQFCLDPPIIPTKRWSYDIPGLKTEWVWQIFRLRSENDEWVKKEGPKKKSK